MEKNKFFGKKSFFNNEEDLINEKALRTISGGASNEPAEQTSKGPGYHYLDPTWKNPSSVGGNNRTNMNGYDFNPFI